MIDEETSTLTEIYQPDSKKGLKILFNILNVYKIRIGE